MTTDEAQKIFQDYTRCVEELGSAKKRGDHQKASEWLAKRDALAGALEEARRATDSTATTARAGQPAHQ